MLIRETYDDFAQELKAFSEIDVHVCYQCGKCSAGCPTAGSMDLLPNQIVRLAQLGARRKILTSNVLWNCVSCGICSSRCPRNIDVLRLIDIFRSMAYKEGIYPSDSEPALFHKLFLSNIARHGRLSELEIGAMFNLKTGHLFKDIELFPGLVFKGKMKFLPENIKDKDYIKRLIEKINLGEKT